MVEKQDDDVVDDRRWLTEHRYRAVLQVKNGDPVAQVARQAGASRQSVYSWIARYDEGGLDALADRSRRPHTSPTQIAGDIEATICELRLAHPRWGARRIVHELQRRHTAAVPGRSTVHRILVRNGLVRRQEQNHRRVYRRWQRDAPMQLWQLDIMGGVFLAGGRECKLVTGIDDHSRFIVIAKVVAQPTGRAVATAFAEAMSVYGVPSEVLTDNGKQFTGRFTKPLPAEVLFERVCRENGISARLTKPRSPTTTGKIERWHKSLRRELLDHSGPFADQATAQAAIDAWVHAYNHDRPHQSLDMAAPASVFRPGPPGSHIPLPAPPPSEEPPLTELGLVPLRLPAELPSQRTPVSDDEIRAVEWETTISAIGRVILVNNQQVKFTEALGGRTVTVWADCRSIHVLLAGELIRTRSSRLTPADLRKLLLRGARIAGPEPGQPSAAHAGPQQIVEVDRTANRDGDVQLGGQRILLAAHLAGQQVTLRFEGRVLHVIAGGYLVKTLASPIEAAKRASLVGARLATTRLPPPPPGPQRAVRKVPKDGVTMVANQRLRVGASHAGKTVTIVIEDTVFRVLDGDIELSVHPRRATGPISRFHPVHEQPTKHC
ncbi:IS481 family transposase [Streptomyces sp. NPDC020883]|uniref:IS481 family transposase n=1 Tax=Streptomyces sp. NPDC020883 TaxID=3365099 RepID=UPI00378A9901